MTKLTKSVAALALAGAATIGLPAAAASAQEPEPVLLRLCVTLQPRALGLTLNGQFIGIGGISGVPRTCIVI